MSSYLKIIHTPISDDYKPHEDVIQTLAHACENGGKFLVEEPKTSRRRWLSWGLPREKIEEFIYFNEHSAKELENSVISDIQLGQKYYLMSDCGTPGFCDPGQGLINRCWEEGVDVKSTPFDNSPLLALILSGFENKTFYFAGFPPRETKERVHFYNKLSSGKETLILMDTPYRLKKLFAELQNSKLKDRDFFFAFELFSKDKQLLIRGKLNEIEGELPADKRAFIVVVNRV